MKRLPLYLVIAVPAASILMGIVTLFVAFSSPDQEIPTGEVPLTKSSWQAPEQPGDR